MHSISILLITNGGCALSQNCKCRSTNHDIKQATRDRRPKYAGHLWPPNSGTATLRLGLTACLAKKSVHYAEREKSSLIVAIIWFQTNNNHSDTMQTFELN